MILDATCQLDYQTIEAVPAVFMLRPRSGAAQWIMREEFHIHPPVPVLQFTDVYGNLCQRIVMPVGEFHLSVTYRVKVQDKVDINLKAPIMPVEQLPTDVLHYLLPSRYCQSDQLSALATSIVGDKAVNYRQVARLSAWVNSQIRYEIGSSDTSTSALETANT
ncbi:MAG: hypothetical protein RL693_1062, partial [Verrucomicrobiota bacterium]